MSTTLLLSLLPILLVLLGVAILWQWRMLDDSSSSCSVITLFLVSGFAFLGDVALLLFRSFRSETQLTATITVSGFLAGGLAWAFKSIRESLLQRAQVLILEYLSVDALDRSTVRSKIYQNSLLFRLNRSIYVDALSALLLGGTIKIENGKYSITGSAPTNQVDGAS